MMQRAYTGLVLLCATSAVLGLASCGKQPAADGYTYDKAQWVRDQRVVELVVWPSQAALQAAAARTSARPADEHEIVAFSRYPASRDVCQINIVDPAVDYKPAFGGHELLHCFRGNWHPAQP